MFDHDHERLIGVALCASVPQPAMSPLLSIAVVQLSVKPVPAKRLAYVVFRSVMTPFCQTAACHVLSLGYRVAHHLPGVVDGLGVAAR